MLIKTLQELRLAFPAHALQSMDPIMGFIDNIRYKLHKRFKGVRSAKEAE